MLAKKVASIIIVTMVLFMSSFYYDKTVHASTTGTVTGDGVNVRRAPSTDARIIIQVSKGHRVTITGTRDGFYHVYFPGVSDGWISTQFVTTSSTTPSLLGESMGVVTGSNVNIRSQPSTSGAVLGRATTGKKFKVTGSHDGWHKIVYNNRAAYISGDFFQINGSASPATASASPQPAAARATPVVVAAQTPPTEGSTGIITGTTVNIRSQPSTNGTVLGRAAIGDTFNILGLQDGWYKVSYNDAEAYIISEFLSVGSALQSPPIVPPPPPAHATGAEEPQETVNATETDETANPLAQAIIEYGKQFIGTPYVFGGTNLESGVDCSGFVYSVMKDHGVLLNRSSRTMVNNGVTVKRSQLQPGDLVFFATDGTGRISHVGIYIGDKRFIHSSSSRRNWGVTINSLDEPTYNRQFVTANRVL